MSVELSTPQHITTLRDCAVQGNVEIRVWLGQKQDDMLSEEVTASKGAASGSAKVQKNLLAGCKEHEAILKYRSRTYNWFKTKSWPYVGSSGLIPTYDIANVMNEFESTIKPEFDRLVDAFCLAYNDIKANYAFTMQGRMYDPSDYPDVEFVRSRFSINLFIQSIPESDFGQKISTDIAAQLSDHYSRQAERFISETADRQLAQLSKVMQSISHCCEVDVREGENGETKVTRRRLHESTLEKAIEYCDLFKHFNPANDEKLEGIRSDLARVLGGVNIKALRDSDSLRATVKSDVDDIMKKFGL
jgi:hypothetical protein